MPRWSNEFRTATLDPALSSYRQGYHKGNTSGLPGVDADLIAANIKWGVTVFGILGTMVQWIYDLSFPALPKLIIPAPVLALVAAEDHSGGANPITPPALTIPAPPAIAVVAEESWLLIEDCEDAWDEYVEPNVTSTADAGDFKVGAASAKMDAAIDTAVGRLATEAIGPFDLSPYKYLKLWIKSTVAITAGDITIMLDEHPACVTPLKDLSVGALVANTWTQVTLDMGDTSGLTAIISIGAVMKNDKGAFILRTDQVRATKGL